jgi:hypothetical protein
MFLLSSHEIFISSFRNFIVRATIRFVFLPANAVTFPLRESVSNSLIYRLCVCDQHGVFLLLSDGRRG